MKKAFLVSHTHWDREWYLTFDRYRCLLVRTLDDLIDELERTEFAHFHLDGQTIVLDDYLAVRPERRAALARLIGEGRLSVGPWYVLQDEFLTSGEANVRNLLRGLRDGAAFGAVSRIGYLPDTFGHFSQMPQLLRGFGIDNAIFCRGLTSSFDAFRSGAPRSPSEVIWEGADGSRVLGVFGSDWYNNCNEVSRDAPEESIRRAVANLAPANATDNYLLFNGCDHQPIQKGLTELLARASERLDGEIEVRHASYREYIEAVRAEQPELQVVRGELTGAEADGQFAFIHTASVRAHLKTANHYCQNLLERHAEPIAVIAAAEGKPYAKANFDLAWEHLMQNHPHDSICGCGIDDVYREMEVRFRKSRDVADYLLEENMEYLAARIDCADAAGVDAVLTVFNTELCARDLTLRARVDLADGFDLTGKTLAVYEGAARLPATVERTERVFGFRNPDDGFRVGGYYRRCDLIFRASAVPAMGYRTYFVRAVSTEPCGVKPQRNRAVNSQEKAFENEKLVLRFREDGSFDVTDKATGQTYERLDSLEDCGDAGDEYTYVAPKFDTCVASAGVPAVIETIADGEAETVFRVTRTMRLPASLVPIDGSGESVVKYDGSVGQAAKKNSCRSEETVCERIVTTVSVNRWDASVRVRTRVENRVGNHRLRAVFPVGVADRCFAHTPFDIVERRADAKPRWQLSDRADRQQAFVYVERGDGVFLLANRGSYEYEQTAAGELKLTLLRCVDELGDWGYFPTPEAQMIGDYEFEYAILLGRRDEKTALVDAAIAYQAGEADYVQHLHPVHGGTLPKTQSCLGLRARGVVLSACKRAEDDFSTVVRFYNPYDSEGEIRLGADRGATLCNLNEEPSEQAGESVRVPPKKIVTLKLSEKS